MPQSAYQTRDSQCRSHGSAAAAAHCNGVHSPEQICMYDVQVCKCGVRSVLSRQMQMLSMVGDNAIEYDSFHVELG